MDEIIYNSNINTSIPSNLPDSVPPEDWHPLSFEEACEVVRSKPINSDMSYEERLAVIKSRFGL